MNIPAFPICSTSSCCSSTTEHHLLNRSSHLYTTLLQDRIILLRHSVHSHLQSLRSERVHFDFLLLKSSCHLLAAYFYNSINNYEEQFDEMFTRTYGSLYTANKDVSGKKPWWIENYIQIPDLRGVFLALANVLFPILVDGYLPSHAAALPSDVPCDVHPSQPSRKYKAIIAIRAV